MIKGSTKYNNYIGILEKELVPAVGCTEPTMVALCAAIVKDTLGEIPTEMSIEVSGNILKNVKSAIIPNSNGNKGIVYAAAIGILCGGADASLEVLTESTKIKSDQLENLIVNTKITVEHLVSEHILDIQITGKTDISCATVRMRDEHTNVVLIRKNGQVIREENSDYLSKGDENPYSSLTMKDIYKFANAVSIEDVREIFEEQITRNTRIADEGLRNDYGANIAKVLHCRNSNDARSRAKVAVAAGTDARMGGCELPVIINSGSGNQGMTVSLPVIEYARTGEYSKEELYRALAVANLTAIHQKNSMGRLSAFCGAVIAGAAAGAGIAFLITKDYDAVVHTYKNALAMTSGIICDGAKPSCAAKTSISVEAGILAFEMFIEGQNFCSGEGIVLDEIESMIDNIGNLAKFGMKETDSTLISMMLE